MFCKEFYFYKSYGGVPAVRLLLFLGPTQREAKIEAPAHQMWWWREQLFGLSLDLAGEARLLTIEATAKEAVVMPI